MKYLYFILVLLIACSPVTDDRVHSSETERPPENPALRDSISIIAVGDMMLGTDFPDKTKFTSKNILSTLSPALQQADFTIGNLEGVLAEETLASVKCRDKPNCYAFRSPPGFARFFKDAGFDFLSVANNHSGDFGDEGLRQTMKALDAAGIRYAGLKNICEYSILEHNGIKVGIIGVGHGGRHVYINDYEHISQLVGRVKEEAHLAVIFFHGGAEGAGAALVPRRQEVFLGESRGNVFEMAHRSIDAGADLVIGSGPHVPRAMELYKNRLIAYSLGNFATYGKVSLRGAMGIAPLLRITLSKNGHFLGGHITATMQKPYDSSTPRLDPDGRVIRQISALTRKNFPGTGIEIGADGTVKIKNF